MMKYKPLLLSPLGLIPMGLQSATAADMPVPVKAPMAISHTPSWAGFYAGVNAGVISERSGASTFVPSEPAIGNFCLAFDCSLDPSQNAVGVLGGAQIGYNFQSGNIVYGVEADFGLSSAKKNSTTLTNGYNWSANTGIDALGTARLRLGYAFDNALLYATGGLAYAKVRDSYQGATGYNWTNTGWRAGYAVGGGLEYMFSRNWSGKVEGLYYDLGSKDHVTEGPGVGFAAVGIHDHMTGAIARIGLNYLFH
jgi:outer membrane immunogenic protein